MEEDRKFNMPQEEQEIREITITKADYSAAIKAEINDVLTNPDFEGIAGPLTIATAGSAFAMAVWGRLTEKKD